MPFTEIGYTLAPQGAGGPTIDLVTVGAYSREVVLFGDPQVSGVTGIAQVLNSAPAGTEAAVVVRPIWPGALPTGANVIGGVTQSGLFNVNQSSGTAGFTKILDAAGTNVAAVDASGRLSFQITAALPGGANVIGGVTQSGTWTVTQSGLWNVNQSAGVAGFSKIIDTGGVNVAGVDASGNQLVKVNAALPTGANVIGGVTQSGTWNVGLSTGANTIGNVNQTVGTAGFSKIVDSGGVNVAGVDASNNQLVKVNAALPAGANVIGGVTQSGTWTSRIVGQAGAIFDVQQNTSAPANSLSIGGVYNSGLPTITSGNQSQLQLDVNGRLLIGAIATGANTIGNVGHAAAVGGTIQASGAQIANGNSGSGVNVAAYQILKLYLTVTVVSGTNPTMDLWVQSSPDGGTTWFDETKFDQVTAASAVNVGTQTISLGYVGGDFGNLVRVRWAIGGTSPSFTFSVLYVAK